MNSASSFAASQGIWPPFELADAQAHAVEYFGQRQSAGADHFGERLRIGPVRPLLVRRHRARRGVIGDQHVLRRLDQRQAAGDLALHEGLLPGRIETMMLAFSGSVASWRI